MSVVRSRRVRDSGIFMAKLLGMQQIIGVYAIVNTSTGELYIGSSNNVAGRTAAHFSSLRRGKYCRSPFQKAWDRDGEHSFAVVLLGECALGDRIVTEQRFVDKLKPEYNRVLKIADSNEFTRSAEGEARRLASIRTDEYRAKKIIAMTGQKRTPEQCAAISASLIGKKRPNFKPWNKLSAEEIASRSQAKINAAIVRASLPHFNKGRVLTAEHREKLAVAKRGRTLTPEHIEACHANRRGEKRKPYVFANGQSALKGVPLSPEHRAKLCGKRGPRKVKETEHAIG